MRFSTSLILFSTIFTSTFYTVTVSATPHSRRELSYSGLSSSHSGNAEEPGTDAATHAGNSLTLPQVIHVIKENNFNGPELVEAKKIIGGSPEDVSKATVIAALEGNQPPAGAEGKYQAIGQIYELGRKLRALYPEAMDRLLQTAGVTKIQRREPGCLV
ncbi:hypothetical protein BC835DRAFT_1364443, partial [Cytidiella melzeri]